MLRAEYECGWVVVATKRTEALTQAVLGKAFAGKL